MAMQQASVRMHRGRLQGSKVDDLQSISLLETKSHVCILSSMGEELSWIFLQESKLADSTV
jgi:hypothetical protein